MTLIENCSVTDNLRNDILKLAKECFAERFDDHDDYYEVTYGYLLWRLESFYRAAFNAGIEAAAKVCKASDRYRGDYFAAKCRELEMKP